MYSRVNIDITKEVRRRIWVSKFELHTHEDQLLNKVCVDFIARFANTAQDEYRYEIPKSWWQHFKATYFKGWLRKKFPPQMEVKTVGVTLLYPKLKTEVPREMLGEYITLMVVDPEDNLHCCSFDPDTPIKPWELERQIYEKRPLYDPSSNKCPTCGKTIRF